jgi:nanoRNase/pAp phosphatase (c-di-AMP/oligoRNAs hydrolase)
MTQTAFVESCAKTVTGSAAAVARRSRGRPKARQLLKVLADKKKILITAHQHPDPDALASCLALCTLLTQKLPSADVKVAFKGGVGGGLNQAFVQNTELQPTAWDEAALPTYDAIILMDTQPAFANSPLPAGITPLVLIDHHRGGRKPPKCAFCDIRPDVGAVSSIIFSYFMELEQKISPELGATLLFAIETDLAGAAGQPGELDNIALSSLTLIADTRKLYKMRYLDLPQSFFMSYAQGMSNANYYDTALTSHLDTVLSPEQPAVIADFLLRFDQAKWALVSGVMGSTLLLSLRTYPNAKISAAELMKRLLRGIGEGGGHRSKAGGGIKLKEGTPAEIDRLRGILRRRLLRSLGIKGARAQRLIPVPKAEANSKPHPAVAPALPAPAETLSSSTS